MLDVNFSPFPVLFTERLSLRPIIREDAEQLLYLRSNTATMQYLDRPLMQNRQEAIELIKKIQDAVQNNEGITWGVSLKGDKKLVGTIGFWRIVKEHFRAEIGYMLAPEVQGKGLMQEAITKVLDFGFSVLKLHSVEANVNPGNQSSIRLLEKNNFIREAYHKENFYHNGRFLDSAIYSLLAPSE